MSATAKEFVSNALDQSKSNALLELKSVVDLPAVKRFAVAETIKIGKRISGLPITFINEGFLKHFAEVIEENVPCAKICYWDLMKWSNDPPIIGALGGEENAQTHLVRLVQAIRLGAEGPGYFKNECWSGIPNLHYVASPVDSKMYVVYWCQRSKSDGRGLSFGAQPITRPERWMSGIPVCGGSEQSPLSSPHYIPPAADYVYPIGIADWYKPTRK